MRGEGACGAIELPQRDGKASGCGTSSAVRLTASSISASRFRSLAVGKFFRHIGHVEAVSSHGIRQLMCDVCPPEHGRHVTTSPAE